MQSDFGLFRMQKRTNNFWTISYKSGHCARPSIAWLGSLEVLKKFNEVHFLHLTHYLQVSYVVGFVKFEAWHDKTKHES